MKRRRRRRGEGGEGTVVLLESRGCPVGFPSCPEPGGHDSCRSTFSEREGSTIGLVW